MVGLTNTLGTTVLLLLLSFVLPGWAAYTVAFAAGVIFSALVTGRWVFRNAFSFRKAAAYALVYLAIYGVGLSVVQGLASAGAPSQSSALSVLVTAPLSFVAARLIFNERKPIE